MLSIVVVVPASAEPVASAAAPATPAGPTHAAVILETATGKAWHPASNGFAPADGSELIPLTPVPGGSPNLAGVSLLVIPAFPDRRERGQYALTLHPAAGGPPVDAPTYLPATVQSVTVLVGSPA